MGIDALMGARILKFFLNPSAYGSDFSVWTLAYRNVSLMGGLISGGVVIFAFSYIIKHSPWSLLDGMILPGGMTIMFFKLGCFINGCCYGLSRD